MKAKRVDMIYGPTYQKREKQGKRERDKKTTLGYECEKPRHDLWPDLLEERKQGKRERKKVHSDMEVKRVEMIYGPTY